MKKIFKLLKETCRSRKSDSTVISPGRVTIYGGSFVEREHLARSSWGYIGQDNKHLLKSFRSAYVLLVSSHNLGHFFHDAFFPMYFLWRKEKLPVIVTGTPTRFQMDFLEAVLGDENIVWAEYDKAYRVDALRIASDGRDIRSFDGYREVCDEIKVKCFNRFGIQEDRKLNVIYSRSSQKRKRLIGVAPEFLDQFGLKDVDITRMDFKSTLELLARTRVFVYMVGASVFNLIFLNENTLAVEINPLKDNSWARMFGLADLCNHRVIVSKDLVGCDDPWQKDPELDSNVLFSTSLREKIAAEITNFEVAGLA